MAITARAAGAWAASNATTQTVTLPTHAAGDLLILRAVCKPYTASITCGTTGWTAVAAQRTNGTTANGNGLGSLAFRAFYKVAESASETDPVVTWGTTSAPGAAVAISYQPGAGYEFIAPVGDGGGDSTARTSGTATIASHVSVTANDVIDFFNFICDNYALTVPALTQSGVTYSSTTEYPATALSSATSNDIAADGGYRTANSGTSSAAAVVTWTAGNAEEGGAWMTRMRVQAATPTVALPLLDGSAAIYEPTVNVETDLSLPLIEAIGGGAGPTVYFTCGAECAGPFTHWSSKTGPVTADGTYKRSGSYGIRFQPSASNANLNCGLGTGSRITVTHGYLYFPSTPTADIVLAVWYPGTSRRLYYQYATNKLRGFSTASNAGSLSSMTMSAGQWYRIDIRCDTSANPWVWDWYIDGELQTQWTEAIAAADTTVTWLSGSATQTADFVWDDYVVSKTTGDFPIGDGSTTSGETWVPAATGERIFAITVAQVSPTVTLPLIDGEAAIYAPTVNVETDLSLPLLDGGAAHTGHLRPDGPGEADGHPSAHRRRSSDLRADGQRRDGPLPTPPRWRSGDEVTVAAKLSVTLPLLDGGATIYEPTVSASGGAQVADLPLLDAGSAIYQPTIGLYLGVALPLLDGGAAIYAPTVLAKLSVSVPLLDAGPAIYAPTVSTVLGLTVPLLDGGAAIFAVTVTYPQTTTLPLVDAGASIYEVAVSQGAAAQSLSLPLLDAISSDYPATVLADDPIAYWRLGEPSGTTASDEMGAADGTYVNSPTLGVTGLVAGDDTAATFVVASAQKVSIASGLPAGSSAGAAIECWAEFSSLTDDQYYSLARWGVDGSGYGHFLLYYRYGLTAKRIYIQFTDGTKRNPYLAWTPTVDTAYHIVASHDYVAKTCAVYINGSLLGTMDLSAYGTPTPMPASGEGSLAGGMEGTYDDAAFYDHTVSSTRAAVHYDVGTGGAGESIFAITVAQPAPTVTLPLIDAGSAIYAPTIEVEQGVTLPLLDGGAAIYAVHVEQPALLAVSLPTLSVRNAILVVGNKAALTSNDSSIKARLEGLGFAITVYSDEDTAPAETGFDLVVIVDSSASAVLGTKYTAFTLPVVVLDNTPAINMDLATGLNTATATTVSVSNATHPAAAGLSGTQTWFTSSTTTRWLTGASAAAWDYLIYPGWPTYYMGFTYNAGDTMANAHVAEGKRAHLSGWFEDQYGRQTSAAWSMLDALIRWACPSIFDVTVEKVGQSVPLPLIDGGATIYEPTVSLASGTAQSVNLELLISGEGSFFGGAFSDAFDIGGAEIYPIGLAQLPMGVELPLLDGEAAIYEVTVTLGLQVSLPLVDGGAAIYAPAVVAAIGVTLPLVDGQAAIYAVTLGFEQDVALPLLDGVATIFALIVSSSDVAGPIDITQAAQIVAAFGRVRASPHPGRRPVKVPPQRQPLKVFYDDLKARYGAAGLEIELDERIEKR